MARPPSADSILRNMKNSVPNPQAHLAGNFVLPNNSGDHVRGIKTKAPINDLDLVNKAYVDSIVVNTGIDLFGYNDASDIATYLNLESTPSAQAKEEIGPISVLGNATDQLLGSWATIATEDMKALINTLTTGIYAFHGHFKAAISGRIRFYMEIYVRSSLGVETLITTTEDSDLITTIEKEYEFHAALTEEVPLNTGDRIVVKGYAKNSSAAATNLFIYVEGDTASRVTIRGLTGAVGNTDATSLLTTDDSTGSKTVASGKTLTHPQLTIQAAHTYTINGSMVTSGTLIVEGTLIINGKVINN